MHNKRVLTIGSASQDTFISCEDLILQHLPFLQGKKVEVKDVHYALGGGALNSAGALKKLGNLPEPLSVHGNDCAAGFIRETLETRKISTTLLHAHPGITGTSYILPNKEGNKTILSFRGCNEYLSEKHLPSKTSHDAIYSTALPWQSPKLLKALISLKKQNKGFLGHNPGLSQLLPGAANSPLTFLESIDLLLVNAYEAETLFKTMLAENPHKPGKWRKDKAAPFLLKHLTTHEKQTYTLRDYVTALFERGAKILLVTHDVHGAYAITPQEILFCPSVPTRVVSSVGAGDAFGGTFFSFFLAGAPLDEALFYAVAQSSCVLHYEDAHAGLLELSQLIKTFPLDTQRIQRFPF